MAEPIADQAIDGIVTRLAGMTGTRHWGGAYPNPPAVLRRFVDPVKVTQFPTLCVVEGVPGGANGGQGTTLAIQVTAGSQVGMFCELKVLLIGYVKGDATTPASRWLMRLLKDCAITLMAENTLGGLVQKIEWGPRDTDGGMQDPVASFVQPLIVTFHESYVTD